jgi:Mrp family chromosome partitioning ATPase
MSAEEAPSCCTASSSSGTSVPGHTASLKLPSSNDSLQERLEDPSPAVTPKHASTADGLANSNTAVQQQDEVDGLAPRTPPLSPKLPAALTAKKPAGKAEPAAAAAAAVKLDGYPQVFEGKRVLIIVSAGFSASGIHASTVIHASSVHHASSVKIRSRQ